MTQSWEPGTQYNYGDIVEYNSYEYKIIQPHRSQSDWTPDVTPALWGRLEGHHGGHHRQEEPQQSWQQQQQHQQQQPQQPPSYDHGKQEQGPPPTDKKEDKNWFEEHKQGLEIAGGLAAGLGLLGAGIGAYKHHEHKNEEKQGSEAWAHAAKARRAEGLRGPATWVYNEGTHIPQGAIATGREHDWTLFIARAWIDGALMIGKASNVFKKGAVIGYEDKEHQVDKYEVLLGNMDGLRWVPYGNRLNVDYLNARPVEGGYENDNTPLFVVRAFHKDAWHPGKASPKLDGAYIPYDGKEKLVKEYEVLCYRDY